MYSKEREKTRSLWCSLHSVGVSVIREKLHYKYNECCRYFQDCWNSSGASNLLHSIVRWNVKVRTKRKIYQYGRLLQIIEVQRSRETISNRGSVFFVILPKVRVWIKSSQSGDRREIVSVRSKEHGVIRSHWSLNRWHDRIVDPAARRVF